jgi:hypothetical protein
MFNVRIVGGGSKLGPLGMSATYWPIVHAPGVCEDGEFRGMNGRGNRSTRRKPAPTPLCPPQIPLDQTWDWTRAAAAVGSQRLTASAMARPKAHSIFRCTAFRYDLLPSSSGYKDYIYNISFTSHRKFQKFLPAETNFCILSHSYGLDDQGYRGSSGRGVKLTTHLQLVPRSRKCGSIHPLPHTPSWRNA